MSDPLAHRDPRAVLARHGMRPRREFSQNFLVALPIVERIADAVGIAPGERVVELGPGVGTLTTALLRRGAEVIAVEKDPFARDVLASELGTVSALRVVDGDATTTEFATLAGTATVAVVGNLPYSVTGAILRNVIERAPELSRVVVMVQKEVEQRLRAEPGSKAYGALTVFVGARFSVDAVVTASPGCFFPPPKVTSAVVRLVPLGKPRATLDRALRDVVRASFDARRKVLRNALARIPDLAASSIDEILGATGIDGRRRGETLAVEEFDRLARALARLRSVNES